MCFDDVVRNLTPDPVQFFLEESFGKIAPAEELEPPQKSETPETMQGGVSPIITRETTVPPTGATPTGLRARLGRIEPSEIPVNTRQVMGPPSSGTPEVSGPQDLPAHLRKSFYYFNG